MAITPERAVNSAGKDDRHFLMGVAVGITHVAAFVDQYVIERRAFHVLDFAELVHEIGKIGDVVTIDLGVIGNVCGRIAMV